VRWPLLFQNTPRQDSSPALRLRHAPRAPLPAGSCSASSLLPGAQLEVLRIRSQFPFPSPPQVNLAFLVTASAGELVFTSCSADPRLLIPEQRDHAAGVWKAAPLAVWKVLAACLSVGRSLPVYGTGEPRRCSAASPALAPQPPCAESPISRHRLGRQPPPSRGCSRERVGFMGLTATAVPGLFPGAGGFCSLGSRRRPGVVPGASGFQARGRHFYPRWP